jgi:hypothetical protein
MQGRRRVLRRRLGQRVAALALLTGLGGTESAAQDSQFWKNLLKAPEPKVSEPARPRFVPPSRPADERPPSFRSEAQSEPETSSEETASNVPSARRSGDEAPALTRGEAARRAPAEAAATPPTSGSANSDQPSRAQILARSQPAITPSAIAAHAPNGNVLSLGIGLPGPLVRSGLMASGESYNPGQLAAAHAWLPIDARVLVASELSGRSVIVRIKDRDDSGGSRIILLTPAAMAALGLKSGDGTRVRLTTIWVPTGEPLLFPASLLRPTAVRSGPADEAAKPDAPRRVSERPAD